MCDQTGKGHISENEYGRLLLVWLDRLCELQLKDTGLPAFDGAILCPACLEVHGRCGDAVYPLVYAYSETGDMKYLEAADGLFSWTENNAVIEGGGYRNGAKSSWSAITVFAAIAIGKTLLLFSDILGKERYERWMSVFLRLDGFLRRYFKNNDGNVNYPVSFAAEQALCWRLTGDESAKAKAAEQYAFAKTRVTEDGLLWGEGHSGKTARGRYPVDLGYNMEESIPNLALYAELTDDREALLFAADLFRSHLAFQLPDGGIDNSFGTRFAKWTYWGSRTSDGCQGACVPFLALDPVFGEAAHRSYELYQVCTVDGLLAGGPMYGSAGVSPCVHHTFCHAKALADLAMSGYAHDSAVPLPRESSDGVSEYPSVGVTLASRGGFLATVSDYDYFEYPDMYPSGGALTMLWHRKTGPLFAATMLKYKMTEQNNMQLPKRAPYCGTVRIEGTGTHGKRMYSILDPSAQVASEDCDDGMIRIRVSGHLYAQTPVCEQGGAFRIEYEIGNAFQIRVFCEQDGELYLPLISAHTEPVRRGEDGQTLYVGQKAAACESGLILPKDLSVREFNPVGGFEMLPLRVAVPAGTEITVTLRC